MQNTKAQAIMEETDAITIWDSKPSKIAGYEEKTDRAGY
jgi:hypothetical protein